MKELEELAFKLNGGWTGVFATWIVLTGKYIAIGYLVHLGWSFIK